MKQLYLNLPQETSYSREDFVVTAANIDAINAIEKYHSWSFKRLLIVGESGAGKTHMCQIWKQMADAKFIDDKFEYKGVQNLIIDNIEYYPDDFIFHVINYAANNNSYLLLTTSLLKTYKLPDLASRINATNKVIIKQPDDELVKILLTKRLVDMQLKFDIDVLDYLIPRVERSYENINYIANQIYNEVSLSKARLTVKLIKNIIFSRGMNDFS